MAMNCNVTNIGLLSGSGWRLRTIPFWTGSSKTNTKGNIIRAASSSVSFSRTVLITLRALFYFVRGFIYFLLLLINVLILFGWFIYLPLPPCLPEVMGHKWLFLVIEAPSVKKLSPPPFNFSCTHNSYFGTVVRNICTLCWTNICLPTRAAGPPCVR